MSVGKYCNREVVAVSRYDSIKEAIGLMRQHHIGDVVVVEGEAGVKKPVGILSDRDIVIELLAKDVPLDTVRVSDVMSYELATIPEETDLLDALEFMKVKAVRRLPVTDNEGNLVGLLTTDDVLELMAEQLNSIVSLISRQQKHELEHRP